MSDKLNFLTSFASCGTQFILEYEMALYARVYQSIKCIKSNRILWWPGLWFYQKQDEYEKELAPNCFGKPCLYRSDAVTWLGCEDAAQVEKPVFWSLGSGCSLMWSWPGLCGTSENPGSLTMSSPQPQPLLVWCSFSQTHVVPFCIFIVIYPSDIEAGPIAL